MRVSTSNGNGNDFTGFVGIWTPFTRRRLTFNANALAAAPRSPRPKIAVPSETTATRLPFAVYRLAADGSFVPVTAGAAEAALAGSLAAVPSDCLVTLDLWDWDRMAGHCGECRAARRARIEQMHRARALLPPAPLDCGCRHEL